MVRSGNSTLLGRALVVWLPGGLALSVLQRFRRGEFEERRMGQRQVYGRRRSKTYTAPPDPLGNIASLSASSFRI